MTSSSASDSDPDSSSSEPLSSSLEVSALALHCLLQLASLRVRLAARRATLAALAALGVHALVSLSHLSSVDVQSARAYTWVSAWKTEEARAKPSSVERDEDDERGPTGVRPRDA